MKVPTQPGVSLSIILGTSVFYGKIYMMGVPSGNQTSFTSFSVGLLQAWYSSKIIPDSIKKLGPIIVLDNSRIHTTASKLYEVKPLPRYSPFLNIAEYTNREHKAQIKKEIRKIACCGVIESLDSVPRGEKTAVRTEHLLKLAHVAWCNVGNENPRKYMCYVLDIYGSSCLAGMPIDN